MINKRSFYKRLRKKGFSNYKSKKIMQYAYKIGKKNKTWKKKYKYPYLNFDGDNKVNKWDCKPWNYKRQDKDDAEIYFGGDILKHVKESPVKGEIKQKKREEQAKKSR